MKILVKNHPERGSVEVDGLLICPPGPTHDGAELYLAEDALEKLRYFLRRDCQALKAGEMVSCRQPVGHTGDHTFLYGPGILF